MTTSQRLSRSIFLLLLLAFGLVTVGSAASISPDSPDSQLKTDTIGIVLVAPADQTLITDPNIEFSWQPLVGAEKYRLTVRSGGFNYKVKLNTSICTESLCTFNPATDPKWQPKFGENLNWSVSSKFDDNKVTSPDWTLATDFLPTAFILNSPAAAAVVTSSQVTFSWQNDPRVDLFKLALKPGNSEATFNVSVIPQQNCDVLICTVNVDLASFNGQTFNGQYNWRVIASQEGVKGKSKSEKQTFTTSLFPVLELEYPADSATVDTANPEFMWVDPLVVEEYRIIAISQAGKQFKTAWKNAGAWCDDDDCYTDSLTLPNDVYNWRVEGRSAGIDGKVKSSSRKLTVYNPEATPEVNP
jgi:hypothetical protein